MRAWSGIKNYEHFKGSKTADEFGIEVAKPKHVVLIESVIIIGKRWTIVGGGFTVVEVAGVNFEIQWRFDMEGF